MPQQQCGERDEQDASCNDETLAQSVGNDDSETDYNFGGYHERRQPRWHTKSRGSLRPLSSHQQLRDTRKYETCAHHDCGEVGEIHAVSARNVGVARLAFEEHHRRCVTEHAQIGDASDDEIVVAYRVGRMQRAINGGNDARQHWRAVRRATRGDAIEARTIDRIFGETPTPFGLRARKHIGTEDCTGCDERPRSRLATDEETRQRWVEGD